MDFPTFLDRIDNRENEAHNNLEKMFGAVEQRIFTYEDGAMNLSVSQVKDQGLVAAHIIGLVLLTVVALVAFIVLCAMRADLKSKITKAADFQNICEICNNRLTDDELNEQGPFRVSGDARKIQEAFDLYESGDFTGLETKLTELEPIDAATPRSYVMSRDEVLCFIKKVWRESKNKSAIQNGQIPAFETIKKRVIDAPNNKMDRANLDTCLKPALDDAAIRAQMAALRACMNETNN